MIGVPMETRLAIEVRVALGWSEQFIATVLDLDLFTVQRVRAGMDEAARPGGATVTDPIMRERQRRNNREWCRRRRAAQLAEGASR